MTVSTPVSGSVRWISVGVFVAVTLALLAGGFWYYRVESENIYQEKHQALAAVAELKSGQIQLWRNERLADADRLARGPFDGTAVAAFLREPGAANHRTALRERLKAEHDEGPYRDVLLLAPDGQILLTTEAYPDPMNPAVGRAIAGALASRKAVLSDLFEEPDGIVHVDATAAVRDSDGRPLAVLVLRSTAETYLFPLIQSWPTPSRSAESALVQREGENVVFLYDPNHRSATWGSRRFPLTRTELPAVQAVLGTRGMFRSRNSRGVEVLADLRPVAGSPWFIVASMNAEEILAEARYRAGLMVLVVGSFILLAAVTTVYGYKRREARVLRISQQALRESEERLRLVFTSTNQGLYDLDVQTGAVVVNPEYARMLGYDPAEFRETRASWYERVHPDDREEVDRVNEECLSGQREEYSVEFRQRTKGGTWKWIRSNGKLVSRSVDGRPMRMVGTHTDITERKRAESDLKNRNVFVETLLEHAPIGFAVNTIHDGRPVFVSRTFERIYGVPPDSLHSVDEFFGKVYLDPVFREQIRERIMSDIASGDAARMRWENIPITTHTGEHKVVTATNIPVPDQNLMISTVQDVTGHRRAEESMRVQAHMLDNIGQAVIATSTEGTITYANRFAGTLYGWLPDDMLGRDIFDVVVPQAGHEQAEQIMARLQQGENWAGEFPVRTRDGKVFQASVTDSPLLDDSGRLIGIIGVSTDITDRKQLETQFLQAQKMETVGRLAGGVAHDFNNLLTVINGTAELASMRLKEGDPLRADLLHIQEAGERAASLTQQLLAFSRRQIMRQEVLHLGTLVAGLHGMLQRLIEEDIELVMVPPTDADSVRADPRQLELVIMNLVVNAGDAMPAGGTLTIEIKDVDFDDSYAAAHPSVQPGPHVMVAISDTGIGMDEATRLRIFEPFFTTKDPGKGTGLGLSTVYGIVKQSGGSVWVYSELGRGTTFKIYLPRVDDVVDEGQSAPAGAVVRGTETILVVEDEEALRHIAERMLQWAGYTVLAASNGGEALLWLERHDGPVHLLLTDVVMPGISGRDLAARLTAIRSDIKVLYTSGYTDDAILRHGVMDSTTHFVAKPYSIQELTRKVREALDSPAPPASTAVSGPAR